MSTLFGTDGIRGEANRHPMDAMMAFAVGQAVTHLLRRQSDDISIMVGRDTRNSGPMLEAALCAGIASMGGTALVAGVIPTPCLAYLTASSGAQAGVMLSASHNPFYDNGIKLFSGSGVKLQDEQESVIEQLICSGNLQEHTPPAVSIGSIRRLDSPAAAYINFLAGVFAAEVTLAGMRLVLDTANGASFQVAPELFRRLGADVTVLHDTPDGRNINQACGSQHTEDLRAAVLAAGATAGLAFDGDADRLIAVDETGNELSGDQILLACALMLHEQGRLRNNLLVSTVMSNFGLRAACQEYGLAWHGSAVGDRYVLEAMRRLGAVIGGEQSGHMIFLEQQTTGDGLLTGLYLLAAMLRAGKPLSALASLMTLYPQTLINVDVAEKPPIETLHGVVAAIAEVENRLANQGRVLVRYSGTQRMCRVMVEGPDTALTDACGEQIAAAVRAAIGAE